MKIAILNYDRSVPGRLADLPLSALLWHDPANPVLFSAMPEMSGTVADLQPGDHLLMYPSTKVLWGSYKGVACRLTLLFEEPRAVHGKYAYSLPFVWWRYFRIFGNDPHVVGLYPNARYLPAGNAWVTVGPKSEAPKARRMSLIASEKRYLKGHALRHEIADWITATGADADLLGRGYKPFTRREDGFEPYQFTVAIENSQQRGYFTEKLIDAFLCDTIPIYWGAPDIADFFDIRGMIVCQNGADIRAAISSLGAQDYERFAVYAKENRRRALRFTSFKRNAIQLLIAEATGA